MARKPATVTAPVKVTSKWPRPNYTYAVGAYVLHDRDGMCEIVARKHDYRTGLNHYELRRIRAANKQRSLEQFWTAECYLQAAPEDHTPATATIDTWTVTRPATPSYTAQQIGDYARQQTWSMKHG